MGAKLQQEEPGEDGVRARLRRNKKHAGRTVIQGVEADGPGPRQRSLHSTTVQAAWLAS